MKKVFDVLEIIAIIILGIKIFFNAFDYERESEEVFMFYISLIAGIIFVYVAILKIINFI